MYAATYSGTYPCPDDCTAVCAHCGRCSGTTTVGANTTYILAVYDDATFQDIFIPKSWREMKKVLLEWVNSQKRYVKSIMPTKTAIRSFERQYRRMMFSRSGYLPWRTRKRVKSV